ncbi:MAG TPA: hypothetical protein VGB68_03675 [Pyrinomonadaceae bacterium]|jgi:hypothetical protein
MNGKAFSTGWKILNALLGLFFLYSIIDAWIQILYFKNPEKHYYYIGTTFFIPLFTCLVVVCGWSLEKP